MKKILITAVAEEQLIELRRILQDLQGAAELVFASEDERIEELLLTDSFDLCFVDYEIPNYRFSLLRRIIRIRELATTLLVTAEPQNYALLCAQNDAVRDTVLLKPLDRDRTLFHVQRILDDNTICETGRYEPTTEEFWRRTKPQLTSLYWEETLYNRNSRREISYRNLSSRALYQYAIAAGIPAESHNYALPVMFFERSGGDATDRPQWERYIQQKNIFETLTLSVIIREDQGYSAYLSEREHMVMFYPYDLRLSANQIAHRCYQFTQEMERQFGVYYTCVVGSACPLEDLHDQWAHLQELAEQSRFQSERVYIFDQVNRQPKGGMLQYAPVTQWVELIMDGNSEGITRAALDFFESNRGNSDFTTDYIVSLVYDLNRYISIAAAQLGFGADDPEPGKKYFLTAWRSAEDFIRWVGSMAQQCAEMRKKSVSQESTIEKATAYIRSNLEGELDRKSIADSVHISQNYLARLFRENLGMTVADFILAERIERAKNYLMKTGLSIMEISERVGFSSSTYFSSCFKKNTGLSPQAFRKQKSE